MVWFGLVWFGWLLVGWLVGWLLVVGCRRRRCWWWCGGGVVVVGGWWVGGGGFMGACLHGCTALLHVDYVDVACCVSQNGVVGRGAVLQSDVLLCLER